MVKRALVAALFIVLGPLLTAGPAQAHSTLDSSVPAADTVVDTAPAQIELTFNQHVEPKFATVAVSDASGKNWVSQQPSADGKTVRVAVQPGLAPQRYTVAYRVVSADGHPITGSYFFTYAASEATSTAALDPAADLAAPPSPAPPDSVPASGARRWVWVLITALLVVIMGGTIVALRGGPRAKP